MNASSTPIGNPSVPRVVGYDMPPLDTPFDPAASSAMVALLDAVPGPEWASGFASESTIFKAQNGLSDVRLVGRNITFMASPEKLRTLPPLVNAFVYRIARDCLQERTFRLADKAGAGSATTSQSSSARSIPDRSLQLDLEAVARIVGIPTILEAVVNATGMRFAAIARVTDVRWTACAVYDLVEFGLQPGQDLVLESTICNEIRQHGNLVTFDQASTHAVFATHPTPAMYGFESYISVPINRPDGSFFGTLCALDPAPAKLDEVTIGTLKMFARMIGAELEVEQSDT